ncbi:hypothetical protein RHSIM_Rhsim01G0121900 [Rhododendron simsii]|uniref:Uncharacterized protein n=1 Tax=Rhododendron simsii TaxID=118357 RepID=A0A834HKE3_RHOSS|nr:hypothetical protein RHSIM_Rhsim01G0121900 [Rhododendron simsii]
MHPGIPLKSESIAYRDGRGVGGGDIENPTDGCISVSHQFDLTSIIACAVTQRLHLKFWEVAEKHVGAAQSNICGDP